MKRKGKDGGIDEGIDGSGEVTAVLLSHCRVLLGSLESQDPKERG